MHYKITSFTELELLMY